MKRGVVKISRTNIDEGKRGDMFCCPVAFAVNESLKYGYYCTVTHHSIEVCQGHFTDRTWYDPTVCYVPTPKEVQEFLSEFDNPISIEELEELEFSIPLSEGLDRLWVGQRQ